MGNNSEDYQQPQDFTINSDHSNENITIFYINNNNNNNNNNNSINAGVPIFPQIVTETLDEVVDLLDYLPLSTFIIGIILATCVWIVNPLTIIAILSSSTVRRAHSNMFILNLAVVDLLLTAIVMFASIYFVMYGAQSRTTCIILNSGCGTCGTAAMLSCFSIAVDRFLFIRKALRYPLLVTRGRVLKTIAAIWITSILVGCAGFVDGRVYDVDICQGSFSIALRVQACIIVSMFIFCGSCSCLMYVQLFFVIREHNKVLEQHSQVHQRFHECRAHACRLQSKLGECHLQMSRPASLLSFTSAAMSRINSTDQIKPSARYFRTSGSCSSDQGTMTRTSSILKTSSVSQSFEESESVQVTGPDQQKETTDAFDRRQKYTFFFSRFSGRFSSQRSNSSASSTSLNSQSKSYGQDMRDEEETRVSLTEKVGERGRGRLMSLSKKWKERKRQRRRCQHLRDLRTIKMLMFMFAIYFICWAPLIVLKAAFVAFNAEPPHVIFKYAWVLAISNSLWNFMVYPMRKRELKRSIVSILRNIINCPSFLMRSASIR